MITISTPTPEQAEAVRKHWLRILVPSRVKIDDPVVPFGVHGNRCARWAVFRAARALVDSLMTHEVRVACLDAVPGEVVGFVAWHERDGVREVHALYVLGPDKPEGARRMGIGTQLLEHALDGAEVWSASLRTKDGDAFLRAFRAEEKAA